MLGKTVTAISGAVAVMIAGAAAQADLITFDPIEAQWINVVPNIGITVDNSDSSAPELRWGSSTGSGQSGYNFFTAATPLDITLPPSPTNPFVLGTFEHLNQPITGTSLTSVTLEITAGIALTPDGQSMVDLGDFTFLFDFTHNETDNNANPCANGDPNGSGVNSNGCADIITVSVSTLTESFTVDNVDYTLDILGFQSDGTLVTGFETKERAKNTATIISSADLTENVVPTPEPATVGLLGVGLTGLGWMARRRRKSA